MASVKAYKKYGVTPNIISWLMRHSPEITHYRDCLDRYQLLYWEGKYLLSKVVNGMIWKDGVGYIVSFPPTCTRGRILSNPNAQYAISFRAAKPEFELPAYVHISIPKERNW